MPLGKVDRWGDTAGDVPVYLQYKGVWDQVDLFQSIMDFLHNLKFKTREKLNMQKGTAFGNESKIMIEAQKKVEEYYEYHIDIYIHVYDETEVDVKLPDGSIKKFSKGRIWIEMFNKVVIDPDRRWDKNIFLAQLRSFYHKYIIQKKIDAIWWDELHYKITLKLRNFIQQRLKMESEEFENRYFAGVH